MVMDNDDVVSTLNDLIETCEDGVKGFRAAADGVKSGELKSFFLDRIRLIERGEAELKAEVRRLGGDPEQHGSVGGSMHRGWINVKSAITGKDDDAIIAECERGENVAVERYEDALKKNLPVGIRTIVERQYQGVVQNRDRVRALKSGASAARSAKAREADRHAPPSM